MPRRSSRPLAVLAVIAVALTHTTTLGGANSAALLSDVETVASTTSTASSFGLTLYLHDDPTPPTAAQASQASLPMDTSAPTATSLFNYDTDRDGLPGRLIAKGASGATETDLTKYQDWRTAPLAASRTFEGSASVEIWSAMKDFGTGKRGVLTAYLREFNPATGTYVLLGTGTRDLADWQGSSGTWVMRAITIPGISRSVQAGQRIDLKIVVGDNAGDDMWLAYDTTAYPSRLVMP